MLGYTVSDKPIRAREKCYPPVWLIRTKIRYFTKRPIAKDIVQDKLSTPITRIACMS